MSNVWVVKDEIYGECFVTICATREAAVHVGMGIIKDWYDGDNPRREKMCKALLDAADASSGCSFFHAYEEDGATISVDLHEVIA